MPVNTVQSEGWTDPATTASFRQAMDKAERKRRGREIRRLRLAKSWSAERLAHEAGVSTKTISRLENGEICDPRGNTYRGVARALSVAESELRPEPRTNEKAQSQLDRIEEKLNDTRRQLEELLNRLPPSPPGELGRRAEGS